MGDPLMHHDALNEKIQFITGNRIFEIANDCWKRFLFYLKNLIRTNFPNRFSKENKKRENILIC